jgi:hypothetical protein
MNSYTEYYKKRLNRQTYRIRELYCQLKYPVDKMTGKKRTFEEAFGYPNDYEVVQEPERFLQNEGDNWKDGYIENISRK